MTSSTTPIKPTVGRKVWYRPQKFEMRYAHTQPFDATITHVWSDTCVNLKVLNEEGDPLSSKTSVTLAQGRPAQPGECEWMPYQQGQAAKTESAESRAAALAVAREAQKPGGLKPWGVIPVTTGDIASAAAELHRPSKDAYPTAEDPLGQRCRACVGDGRCAGRMMDCPMGVGMNVAEQAAAGLELLSVQATSEQSLEEEIRRKGLNAPRLQPSDLDAEIQYTEIVKHVSAGGQVLRWAVLTLRNGFAVTGRPSVSVSPENDDAEVGTKVAISNARNEMWPLLGYALKDRMHRATTEAACQKNACQIKAGCTD